MLKQFVMGEWVEYGGGGGGTTNYNALSNRPKINGFTLQGNLTPADLGIDYGASFTASVDPSTFVMTFTLKDQNGNTMGTASTVDLPLESVVVSGAYDDVTQKVILTLQNGNTIEFSVADLVAGLQTELSASNKLDPAFINYDSTHAAVTESEKTTWGGKQDAIADLNSIRSGAEAGATAVQPGDLSAYQTKIDSSHKLNSDLVSDANQTNKFVTSTEKQTWNGKQNALSGAQLNAVNSGINSTKVGQIATHDSAIIELVDSGFKNRVINSATDDTVEGVDFTVNSDGTVIADGTATTAAWFKIMDNLTLPAGTYRISGGEVVSGTVNVRVVYATTPTAADIIADSNGDSSSFTLSSSTTASVYIRMSTGRTADRVLVKPMICTKAAWDMSSVYEPGVLSLPENYAHDQFQDTELLCLQETNTKNILLQNGYINTSSGVTFTTDPLDGSIELSGANNNLNDSNFMITGLNTSSFQFVFYDCTDKTYRLSVEAFDANGNALSNSNINVRLFDRSVDVSDPAYITVNSGSSATFTGLITSVVLTVKKGFTTNVTGYKVRVMICDARLDTIYVPPAPTNRDLNFREYGKPLPNNADLDLYIQPGTWYGLNAQGNSVVHGPIPNGNQNIRVRNTPRGAVHVQQEFFVASNIYTSARFVRCYNTSSKTWTVWEGDNRYSAGVTIPNNTDLDDLTMTGAYRSESGTVSGTLSHSPVTNMGFRLEVINTGSLSRVMQEIIPNDLSSNPTIYRRTIITSGTGAGAKPWIRYAPVRELTLSYAGGISSTTCTECDYSAIVTGDLVTINFRVVLNTEIPISSTFALLSIPSGYRPPLKTVFTAGYANNKLIPMWVNTGGEVRIRVDEAIPASATIGGTITYIYNTASWKTLETAT